MCFANRVFCKRCRKETITYISKCDQYPEIKTETATHAIRGRHLRVIACRKCKREVIRLERHRAEEESRRNAVDHPRAKAILEWRRSERPLPLTDEETADRYAVLFFERKRLHPFCTGFTNIHTEKIESRREYFRHRAEAISEACEDITHPMSVETREAINDILDEEEIFEECLKRQAEIDRGDRIMTDSEQFFSLHRIGRYSPFALAIDLIDRERYRFEEVTFESWTQSILDAAVTEDSFNAEITGYLAFLEQNGSTHQAHRFRGQVIARNEIDEDTFEFDPNAGVPTTVADSSYRLTFQEWAQVFERRMGTRIRSRFERWQQILMGYRSYLAWCAPAQHTLFIARRNSIAAQMFRSLTGRSEPEFSTPDEADPEIEHEESESEDAESEDAESEESESEDAESEDAESEDDLQQILEELESDEAGPVPDEDVQTETRDRIEGVISPLENLLQISQSRDHRSVTHSLLVSIAFLDRQSDRNIYPREIEWRAIRLRTAEDISNLFTPLELEQVRTGPDPTRVLGLMEFEQRVSRAREEPRETSQRELRRRERDRSREFSTRRSADNAVVERDRRRMSLRDRAREVGARPVADNDDHQAEPESDDDNLELFFIDTTPMQVVPMEQEQEPDNIAYTPRHILGLPPPSPLERHQWRGEEWDEYESFEEDQLP
ncbi:hypothetical protein NHQ30_011442 [Ciborinia camelliae]|nr:hypothetical protein NHQ30_011442 [Ciborinia camelliae]